MWGVPDTGYSLEEYWEFLQIAECAAYGIKQFPGQSAIAKGCGDYWNQNQRYFLAAAIAKAEKRLREPRWLGYPVRRTYYTRELPYLPCSLDVGVNWLRCIGVHTTTIIASAAPITLNLGGVPYDPVILTQAVGFTDVDELILYYTGQTKYEIRPSSVVIAAGVATIEIPRCRLLKPEFLIDYTSDADRPDYGLDTNFVVDLDIARDYCKPPGGNFVWARSCPSCGCSTCNCLPVTACGETLQYACGYVKDQKMGLAQFEPVLVAADGSFTTTSYTSCRTPDKVQVQFMAGYHDRYDDVDEDLVRAIIAIAHNNMPLDVCGCSMQERYYKRDVLPIEPAVQLGLGPSTWGINEAVQIVIERRVEGGAFF